ncbi:PRMT7, partial [Symbiodinium sp. KB8]
MPKAPKYSDSFIPPGCDDGEEYEDSTRYEDAMTRGHWVPPRLKGRNESLIEAVNDWHFAMLNDSHRNQFYWDALAAVVQGKRVIDIGSGSGLLSLMAAKLGASSVVAVEASQDMAELARLNAERNGQEDKIKILHALSSKVQLSEEARADVIVSETLGALMLGEGTVHQGHTNGALPTSSRAPLWDPPVLAPKFFSTGDNWRAFLKEEGYAVLSDVLPGDAVAEALKLLLEDLQMLSPELRSLDEVREHHLPRSAAANDLRSSAGLCHGNFAWFLRCRPEVTQLFEAMFDLPEGAPLIGSVDVVALAPPGSSKTAGKQWLHLDYTPPQGTIWQACLQLFPRTEKLGSRWERIALMICKAPAAWAAPSVPRMLLAACVTGSASRATAGVTLGKLHREAKEALAVRLLPELTIAPQASVQAASHAQSDVDRLRLLTAQEAARRYPAERLRALLPPCRAQYVSPECVFSKVARNPAKQRAARPRASALASARVAVRPPPTGRFMSLL